MDKEQYFDIWGRFEKLYDLKLDFKDKSDKIDKEDKITNGDVLKSINLGFDFVNKWDFMTEYINYQKEIIDYLDSLNKGYCDYYKEYQIKNPDKTQFSPPIFIHFRRLVESIRHQNFEKAAIIRNYILTNY